MFNLDVTDHQWVTTAEAVLMLLLSLPGDREEVTEAGEEMIAEIGTKSKYRITV